MQLGSPAHPTFHTRRPLYCPICPVWACVSGDITGSGPQRGRSRREWPPAGAQQAEVAPRCGRSRRKWPPAEARGRTWHPTDPATGQDGGMEQGNLLAGPPPTYLPEDPAAAELEYGVSPADVAAAHPACLEAWAALADDAMGRGETVASYAYARTGYHRGLDRLRRAGWRGQGPIPWEHVPNRGFLRSLHALGRAAAALGEKDEAERCRSFLQDASPLAAAELNGA